jgi:hypothetical protein
MLNDRRDHRRGGQHRGFVHSACSGETALFIALGVL